ncbi:aspartate kinase [Ilyomonas limi]|uniref:Aspartokinase n=1 Tax=Ilyomonas limi TaxID=2575867 RepID=A0A4V5UUI6_9BACT|nr:aspartate kinase [Ilyomonas limi]TKK67783.1 aspartate kinase [Ilyomonas limi]
MKVFKFGGASVSTVDRIHNVGNILQEYNGEQLMVIISAMGKTTNALEKVAEAFYAGNTVESLRLFDVIKQQHITTAKYLLVTHYNACLAKLTDFFTEVEWLLHDKPSKPYDYYYDQVVCVGEMLSTCIVSHYLRETGIANKWIDVRDVIRTDDNFRDATIDWTVTEAKTKEWVQPLFRENNIAITQGFVGSTDENESTTLGREGSDFTAAIFANILDAESLTIWKDVEGVMNADPKIFSDAQLIKELSFAEVIEMAYYGAQVIHPKTIKPLQNKSIPLHVKCFLDIRLPGTIIYNKQVKNLPPIIILKNNQALLHLSTQDFSFVGEAPMSRLYNLFGQLKIKPNLIQTGAINVQLCMDDKSDKTDQLAAEASQLFDVQVVKNLTLLTIRHFTKDLMNTMLSGKNILLQQQTKETVQVLYV